MSHNLNFNEAGQASMFYYGDEPWHGFGKKVNRALTAQEALEEAGLDYEVVKQPIYLGDNTKIDGKFATCRTDKTGEDSVLGVVGDRYTVIQNADMLNFFDPIVGRQEAVYHTAGVLGKGERIWLMAKLPESMRIGNEDIIDKYILLTNSHDGTKSAIVKICTTRVVCENTLNFSLLDEGKQFNIRHTTNYQDKLDQAYKVLGIAQDYFKVVEQQIQQMSMVDFNDKQLMDYVNGLLGITEQKEMDEEISTRMINKRAEILELAETGKGADMTRGTLWGAVNAVTEFVDHHSTVKNGKYIDSVWFGSGNDLKTKAYTTALNLFNNN